MNRFANPHKANRNYGKAQDEGKNYVQKENHNSESSSEPDSDSEYGHANYKKCIPSQNQRKTVDEYPQLMVSKIHFKFKFNYFNKFLTCFRT